MKYKLKFTRDVKKQLKKMDKFQPTLLVRWLYQNIDETDDPRQYGKALSGNTAGRWRYRVGKYRIIVEIEDDRMVVTAIQVGHRRNLYDK